MSYRSNQDRRTRPQYVLAASQERVIVPRVNFQPCPTLSVHLRAVDPLRPSANFGEDIFREVVELTGHHLSNGCNDCLITSVFILSYNYVACITFI